MRKGEESKVDISKASMNPDPVWPPCYYARNGGVRKELTSFVTACKANETPWYDGDYKLDGVDFRKVKDSDTEEDTDSEEEQEEEEEENQEEEENNEEENNEEEQHEEESHEEQPYEEPSSEETPSYEPEPSSEEIPSYEPEPSSSEDPASWYEPDPGTPNEENPPEDQGSGEITQD